MQTLIEDNSRTYKIQRSFVRVQSAKNMRIRMIATAVFQVFDVQLGMFINVEGFWSNFYLFEVMKSFSSFMRCYSLNVIAVSYFFQLGIFTIPRIEQQIAMGSVFFVKTVQSIFFCTFFLTKSSSILSKHQIKLQNQTGFISATSLISLHLQVLQKYSYSSISKDTSLSTSSVQMEQNAQPYSTPLNKFLRIYSI